MQDFEKLGSFYLGKRHDLEAGETTDELLLYDAKDLTTHAICVGMTGSGKTGLCMSLLEEAAIDGIPAIVIDPKGDLGNLMLTFPELRGKDFRPWINEDDARRKQQTPDDYAEAQAQLWKKGLASWGQDGERIRKMRDAAELDIYTPGSEAGIPVSILSSFGAPPEEVRSDGDLMRERVSSTVTSLLGLMGIKADPIQSREHIVLSLIFDRLWREGTDLDLGSLIEAIQNPPIQRVGVLELDSFYPAKERFELAMQLNNLLAAPGFQGWLTGVPLDIQQLLYTPEGKPRVAIFSIAHLSDEERMFFVSLLLNQFIGWMRSRPGTTSLRALLYMDEIFGFIPPTAEPPSKKPFLTLLKQARAYGVGVVMATQNPVDLDYKGLSNTGTWFLGRLQTERDKMRVLEGLEGAASGGTFDKQAMEQRLAGMGKRVFMMHNVHEAEPVVFHTRWAMSYLRGPLARQQIKRLMDGRREQTLSATPQATEKPKSGTAAVSRPALPPGVPQFFVPDREGAESLVYRPHLLGMARVRYADRKTKRIKHTDDIVLALPVTDDDTDVNWERASELDLIREDLEPSPDGEATYVGVMAAAENPRSYISWKKSLSNSLYRNRSCDLYRSEILDVNSEPGEMESDFRIRLAELARERRDGLTDKLRKKYARRKARLEERIRKSEQAVEKEKGQASSQKVQTAISFGTTILSAFLGRKAFSLGTLGRARSAARGVGRASKETQDIARAEENLASLVSQLEELNQELQDEIDTMEDRNDPLTEKLETTSLRPRRADVDVQLVALAWKAD